jgi:hypothetical protein
MLIDLRAGEMKILEASLAVRHSSITQCLGRFPDTGRPSGTVNEYVRVVEAYPMFGVARRNPLRRKGRIFD